MVLRQARRDSPSNVHRLRLVQVVAPLHRLFRSIGRPIGASPCSCFSIDSALYGRPVPPSYLLDTNILVYCFDDRNSEKQERAHAILERAGRRPSAALPAQVLAEFANVMLYKMEPPLPPGDVYTQMELYKRVFPIFPLTASVSLEAARGTEAHSFRFFDAQIWAVAKLNQVPVVLSEDFPVGSTVEGVTFENPLDETFDLADL